MNDLQPLLSMLSQAERDRDTVLAAQREVLDRLSGLKVQSEQLANYRKEYELRWTEQFKSQGGIEVLRYYQSFNERIQQALTHQQRTEAQVEAQLQTLKSDLLAREMKVASIKKLIERRTQERARIAQRQEQKLTDEMAARSFITAPGRLPNSTY